MLLTFEAASEYIKSGKLLHIACTESMLRKLPKGNWIGGSTEYFISKEGGIVSGEMLSVTEFPFSEFKPVSYGVSTIGHVAEDAYDNGFSIVIIPFDSAVHKEYAQNAAGYEDMFMKSIVGWIAGINLGVPGQTPVAVNGATGEVFTDQAVAMHIGVPDDKIVSIKIVNIFEQDENSPVIEFTEEGFSALTCLVGGQETVLADYIAKNGIDTKLPLVGDYSGSGINISFKSVDDGVVHFYAPVFSGIKYRMAKNISDYEKAFNTRLATLEDSDAAFSCNCVLNFLYGELEGKTLDSFVGPITFGEIAYQLLNQTLVYVTVS